MGWDYNLRPLACAAVVNAIDFPRISITNVHGRPYQCAIIHVAGVDRRVGWTVRRTM